MDSWKKKRNTFRISQQDNIMASVVWMKTLQKSFVYVVNGCEYIRTPSLHIYINVCSYKQGARNNRRDYKLDSTISTIKYESHGSKRQPLV